VATTWNMLIRLNRLIRGDMWRPCGGEDLGMLAGSTAHHVPWKHMTGNENDPRLVYRCPGYPASSIAKLLWSGNATDGVTSLKS